MRVPCSSCLINALTGQVEVAQERTCPVIATYQALRQRFRLTGTPCCCYCNFAYSDLAAMRTGRLGSASFHSVRKSL
jgi:hypothetical protein